MKNATITFVGDKHRPARTMPMSDFLKQTCPSNHTPQEVKKTEVPKTTLSDVLAEHYQERT